MEVSKLISRVIVQFKIAYPYYFRELSQEELAGLTVMYQNQLNGYTSNVILKAVDKIIATSKYMPSIAELLNECSVQAENYTNTILVLMLNDGYFKKSLYGAINDIQATRNYEKATKWVNSGIIPEWFLKDMISYGYKVNKLLSNKEIDSVKLLEH